MNSNEMSEKPLSDLTYDLMTIVQRKSQALDAYETYVKDAEEARSPECAQLMRQIYEDDKRHVQQATEHLRQIMHGSTGQGQTGQ